MDKTLETERLVLRPLRRDDAGPIALFSGEFKVAGMHMTIPHPYPPGAAEALIERSLTDPGDDQHFAVAFAEDEERKLIGLMLLRRRPRAPSARIGYWIGSPFWGRGYATEAAGAVVDHAFADETLEEIETLVNQDNPASIRVLEKLGFRQSGEGEEYSESRRTNVPNYAYELRRAEWEAGR